MANKITFSAQNRTVMGKKTNQLRRAGLIPANVMGHSIESVPVSLATSAFTKLYQKVGDTGLFYLEIEGQSTSRPVLIDQVDYNPVTGTVQHVVMKQVNLKEKINAEIPVELVGELTVPEAVVLTVQPTIEVEALPTDLPEKFEIDISVFTEIGQSVLFKDLAYDRSKVELQVSEEELETPVVIVQELAEEVVEEVAETPAEGEPGETTPESTPEAGETALATEG